MKINKYIRSIFLVAVLALGTLSGFGQAWIEPSGDDFNPEDTVTIYVDLSLTTNEWGIVEIAQSGEDMYFWTWLPYEHALGHPFANGEADPAWKNSNENLKMTLVENVTYSYKMIPTEFYEVDAGTVYENDFAFLVKPKDGGGFGDPDLKTEDLTIDVEPPSAGDVKVYSFPDRVSGDTMSLSQLDVFTLVYNQNLEEKPSLQGVSDFYVYARAAGDDGVDYKVSNLSEVGSNPDLEMKAGANGLWTFSFIPKRLYNLPEGVNVQKMRLEIVRQVVSNSDDAVDGTYEYVLSCDE